MMGAMSPPENCPCGCPEPVKSGNDFATGGCDQRARTAYIRDYFGTTQEFLHWCKENAHLTPRRPES
jgi:hypothetical protein